MRTVADGGSALRRRNDDRPIPPIAGANYAPGDDELG
jgi:hypothetical protein